MTAAHSPLSPAGTPRPGLRERKKTKTREAIRTATYALIGEQGYDATTIEQIAERAEVSPSTVFRYFPAKEDIVLRWEYDPLMAEELRARPAGESWTHSLRHVLGRAVEAMAEDDPEALRVRARLALQVPAVRDRMAGSTTRTGRLLGTVLAERSGLDPDGLQVRVHVTSLVGGLMEVYLYWAERGFEDDLPGLLARGLDLLEHGLPGENP
ncbi:TetR/AcrR family transcriptional regulator [Streptomyces sp. NPDC048297]|uniref:TetR/AcrR family transcriptional regulator n=1 Tax=Streptomyces sp. NPDC048297 TaxID=3365531 RepID=UPI00371F2BD3